ncbi:mitotic-spindle organizing protein 2 isoform X4 [Gadus macrocephalus]|uniref:mitotic-spindle organizing protein 2 isoform X4 n=1 Tax=Gadus macrocephalus TaxID=80720 RepID=UPI0028CBAE5D|nr:mitotic-spindle organizing protein 2 isoform X4 [Gadus macrocephalus]
MMSQQPQPPSQVPQAPDSPVVVVSGNVQKYAMKKKKILNAEESELFELTQAAGITMDQEVFKIIVDLLKMNVAPQAVFQTLKAMCAGQRIVDTCAADASKASHPAGTTTAQTTEHREDTTLVPSKSSKPPAAASSASGPRAARLGSKIVVYGSQDNSSSQVRSKAGHSEKTRESSSQRVQRPPSATRGQKTKSSGSSSSSSQIASN